MAVRMCTAFRMPEHKKIFTADHPFIFVILHHFVVSEVEHMRSVLFAGKITKPE